jgi:hypothetical protein
VNKLLTLEEFLQLLLSKHGVVEKPKIELSLTVLAWPDSLSDSFFERLLPPGKRLQIPVPEGPRTREMEPAEIVFICSKLRIKPAVIGVYVA